MHWLLNHRTTCFRKKSFGLVLPCSSLGSRLKGMHMRRLQLRKLNFHTNIQRSMLCSEHFFDRQQNVAKRRRWEESPTRCSPKTSTDLCPTNALPAVFTPRLACCRAPSFALQEVLPMCCVLFVICLVMCMGVFCIHRWFFCIPKGFFAAL